MQTRILFLIPFLLAICSLADEEMRPSSAVMKQTLQAVITGQLDAFRVGNFAAGYGFAEAQIKDQFPVEAFERMVKTGYPLIAKSVSVSFGLAFDDGNEAVVAVRVVGANDESASYHYKLKREGNLWRIGGVIAVENPPLEV